MCNIDAYKVSVCKTNVNNVGKARVLAVMLPGLMLLLHGCAVNHIPTTDSAFALVRPVHSKPLPIENGAIYKSGYEITLFEDRKAKKIGDLLTVVLLESTNATKKASTITKKDSELDIPIPTFLGRGITKDGTNFLESSLDASRRFKGEGNSSQSNSLSGTLTVTVSEVMRNGNLVIRGEKLLTLNQGSEHVRLSGVVRPDDITPQNTIKSGQISNAKIVYGGQGVIADSNAKGWLQRFFDGPWWPF
ncbi:MAG: flagellar basal body L-ring protein FlgH [Gammaproteobacteria bacterium]|nr:flagellar basal body L-ring protein FlgH [Gammaproteobacteria bacterium]